MERMSGLWRVGPVAGLLLLLAFPAGPVFARKRLENIPLVWKPTTAIGSRGGVVVQRLENMAVEGSPALPARPRQIRIESFKDTRRDPRLIAENHEDVGEEDPEEKQRRQPLPVTTRDSVAEWCGERLGYLLGEFGHDVVGERGDVVITGEVRGASSSSRRTPTRGISA